MMPKIADAIGEIIYQNTFVNQKGKQVMQRSNL
jgi:hypothetical protein